MWLSLREGHRGKPAVELVPASLYQALYQATLCICHKGSHSLLVLASLLVYSYDIQSYPVSVHHQTSACSAPNLYQVLHWDLIKQVDFPQRKTQKGNCIKIAGVIIHSHGLFHQSLSYSVSINKSAPLQVFTIEDPPPQLRAGWGRASVCKMYRWNCLVWKLIKWTWHLGRETASIVPRIIDSSSVMRAEFLWFGSSVQRGWNEKPIACLLWSPLCVG